MLKFSAGLGCQGVALVLRRKFFRLFRLSPVRQTYIVMKECMVEAAGVEPYCTVHLFASACTYHSLSASNDISEFRGNADRCS